jgi:hypothetical protein
VSTDAVVCKIETNGKVAPEAPKPKPVKKESKPEPTKPVKKEPSFNKYKDSIQARVDAYRNQINPFDYEIGDKVVQICVDGWSFDRKGIPHRTPDEDGKIDYSQLEPYMEVTGIGRTLYFFVCGGNEHVGSLCQSFMLAKYNPLATSIEDYLPE